MEDNLTSPLVSVIIPHYGGQSILQECISSLQNCNYKNIEIIVVDNNSNDNSIDFINDSHLKIKLITSDYNRGFAGGCNYGVQFAKGEFILILNNDTTHEPNWIKYLIEKLKSDKSISSVQPKILNYYNKNCFDYAGSSGGFIDKYCFPFSRGRIFSTIEEDHGQYDESCQIFWASGTAFLTRREIYNKIGGFDETLFAHMEEIDFHWKCQLIGYEIWVEPLSVIYHKGGATLPYASPQKTYLNYRNSLILLLTNYPLSKSIYLFFPRIMMEAISFIKEIIIFKWLHAFSIIRSWFWIIFNLKYLYERRKSLISYHTFNNNLIYQQSIVKKYFIERKKYFKEII